MQSKYLGTGHADVTQHEWAVNQHRDSAASYLGHSSLLMYFGLAENNSLGRQRFNILQNMAQPCGPPPPVSDD